jgi:hypothetical protein
MRQSRQPPRVYSGGCRSGCHSRNGLNLEGCTGVIPRAPGSERRAVVVFGGTSVDLA